MMGGGGGIGETDRADGDGRRGGSLLRPSGTMPPLSASDTDVNMLGGGMGAGAGAGAP